MRYSFFSILLIFFALSSCNDPKNLDRDKVKDLIFSENGGIDTIRTKILINNYFTAKDLKRYALDEEGYWTLSDSPSKKDDNIVFLPKSKSYLIGKPASKREGDIFRSYVSKSQSVATMILELDEVTGIRMNPSKDKAIADVTLKLKETTPFVVLDSIKHELYKKNGLKTQIPFTLYDEGWRLEKNPGLNFAF